MVDVGLYSKWNGILRQIFSSYGDIVTNNEGIIERKGFRSGRQLTPIHGYKVAILPRQEFFGVDRLLKRSSFLSFVGASYRFEMGNLH